MNASEFFTNAFSRRDVNVNYHNFTKSSFNINVSSSGDVGSSMSFSIRIISAETQL